MAINLDRIQAPRLETPTVSSGGSLAANTTYYYCVVAVGGSNNIQSYQHDFESPRSNIVQATTTDTNKTINLSWNAPAISQSGSFSNRNYGWYAVLRSTNKSDLEGKEQVPILINTSYTNITTNLTSIADDGVTYGTAEGTKSYFWYRPWGCPKIHLYGDATESDPYTMADLYAADLAGTLELLPEVEATDTPHRLYTPVNPADSKQLALDIIVTNFTSAGSVELTGKDAGGDAKSETISITGNGTYTSTKTYASIDEDGIVCTGDYTLKIIQNRWGFIEPHVFQYGNNIGKIGTANWTIHCSFYNETHFLTKRENIFISGGFNPGVSSSSNFVSGELSASGAGKNGSHIMFHNRRWFAGINFGYITYSKFYGSQVHYGGTSPDVYGYRSGVSATWYGNDGDWRTNPNGAVFVDSIWDIPSGSNGFLVSAGSNIPTLSRGMLVGSLQPRTDNSTYDYGNMTLVDGAIAHQIDENCEHQNMTIVTTTPHIYYWGGATSGFTYKNFVFKGRSEAEPYNEPYIKNDKRAVPDTTATFKSDLDLKVIDSNGNPVEGATVKLTRSNGTLEGTQTTNSSGVITPIEGVYTTWVINRSGGSSSGYAINNRGGLTPTCKQVTATNYTHTLTISKDGYQTYTSKLDMSSKKELVIKLEKAVDIVMIDDDLALNTNPKNPRSNFFSKI